MLLNSLPAPYHHVQRLPGPDVNSNMLRSPDEGPQGRPARLSRQRIKTVLTLRWLERLCVVTVILVPQI